MRRATLLAALLAPALAGAQSAGEIIFRDFNGTETKFVNADTCNNDRDMGFTFTIRLTNSPANFPGNGIYRLYAQNALINDADCAKSGLIAAQGGDMNVVAQTQSGTIVHTGSLPALVGYTCAETTDKPIYFCVQGTDKDGNVFGVAKGQLTLSTWAPSAPTIETPLEPGDGALEISWSKISNAKQYRLEAQSTKDRTATDPFSVPDDRDTARHDASGITINQNYRLDGLVNGVDYAVRVFAISAAGNEGPASGWAFGVPIPSADFWTTYKARNGVDSGGCSSGTAGLLGLGGAASLLAIRRRKR